MSVFTDLRDRLLKNARSKIQNVKTSVSRKISGTPDANQVFTSRVSPQLKAKAQASYESPTVQALKELPKPALDVVRSTPRATISLVQKKALGTDTFTPTTRFERAVLGNEPIKSYQTSTGAEYLKSKGVNPKLANLAGLGLVAGSIAADVTGAGKAGKGLEKTAGLISKANKVEDVTRLLKGSKITADAKTVEGLVKETNQAKVLESLKSASLPSKTAVEAGSVIKPSVASKEVKVGSNQVSPALPKLIQPSEIPLSNLSRSSTANITPDIPVGQVTDPVQKIITALKEAKPLAKEQRALTSELRSKQFAKLMSARGRTSGEKGYFAELGALKGGAKKVDFETIRSQLSQSDIDSLFNKINDANIGEWEKLNAKSSLTKLLSAEGGAIPTQNELKLLNDVYGNEFVKTILDKRSTFQKVLSGVGEALNLPRSLMASFDMSAPLRQGIVFTSRPKQFFPAFLSMFKQAGSEKAFKAVQDEIAMRPTYKLMRESKLALTDMGNILSNREETFMSNFAEKIPLVKYGVKASNRAYTGFLNKLRADVFDDLLSKAKLLGNDERQVTDDIARFVNSATGRGDLGALNKAATTLNSVFFSPRLMAARVNMLDPTYYTKLSPMVRKEALKSMLTLGAVAGTTLGLAKAAGADVETDPRSADFGKIKIGDTRYDILGGFQQYVVLASRLISGKMVSSTTGKEISLTEGYKPTTRLDIIMNFLKSKENPILSYATGALEGTTQLGREFKAIPEAINRFIPMFAQDIVELTEDRGFAKAIGMELPSMLGIGVQTYGKQIPVIGQTQSGRSTVQWRNPADIGEKIYNKLTGDQVTTFSKEDQKTLDTIRRQEAKVKAETDKILSDTQKKMKSGQSIDGVIELPDGRGMYISGDEIKYADSVEEAQTAVDKENFKQSGENFQIIDGMVYRKNKNGDVQAPITEDSYNTQLNTAKLSSYKKNNNYQAWQDTAQKQLDLLTKQLDDQTLDELDKIDIQNKIDSLLTEAEKYAGYGGFKKATSNKKTLRTYTPTPTKAKLSLVKPTLKALKTTSTGGSFKRPTATVQKKGLGRGV